MCLSIFLSRYLKTTVGNIKLISKFRNKEYDTSTNNDEKLFAFWMEFFIDATDEEYSSTQFPVSGWGGGVPYHIKTFSMRPRKGWGMGRSFLPCQSLLPSLSSFELANIAG